MMSISSLTLSVHAYTERADRIAIIDNKIGWGQIIKEVYEKGAYRCLTDTGVILVVDENRTTVVTLYLADRHMLHRMYNGNAPHYMRNRIQHNMECGYVHTIQMYHRGY